MNNAYFNDIPNNPLYNVNLENKLYDNINSVLNKTNSLKVNVYANFPNSKEKVFSGILEASGKDFIIVSDPSNGSWNLIPSIFINYIEFNESIIKYLKKDN